jgi:hypothetical protein
MEWGNSGAVCGGSILEEYLGLSAAECPSKSSEVIRQGPPERLGVSPFLSVRVLFFPYCSSTKATATLEPETTQHNSQDRLQIRK